MPELTNYKADFDAICEKYELPMDDKYYPDLLDIFIYRREGNPYSMYELFSDFSALEIGKMLKQLLGVGNGGIILQNVGGIEKNIYSDTSLLEVLTKSLEKALQERVEKIPHYEKMNGYSGPCIMVKKGGTMEGLYYEYPEGCVPQEKGFSEVELDIIILGEEKTKESLENELRGNKEKWEDGYTRLPDLGEQALTILDDLPQEWTIRKKHCFIADFLFHAGFLDFKSRQWKERYNKMEEKEKDRMVRNWIKADMNLNEQYP